MNINIDLIYPVGSVYITTNDVNPKVLFGGEWEQTCKSRCLAGAGTNLANTNDFAGTYAAGTWGFGAGGRIGEWTHTLTTSEMPSHGHGWTGVNDGASTSGAGGNYPFRIYQDIATNWTGTAGNIGSTGGSGAHNNLPPMEFFYIWKRVA